MSELKKISYANDSFDEGYFTSVVYSPDGKRLLTSNADNTIRVLTEGKEKEELKVDVNAFQADCIYSTVWHPSGDFFLTSIRGEPIKLCNASNGETESSYLMYNDNGETLADCYGLTFGKDENEFYAGTHGQVYKYDIEYNTVAKTRFKRGSKEAKSNKIGIMSCVSTDHSSSIIAAGSSSGAVYLYDQQSLHHQLTCVSTSTTHHGATHLEFSIDDWYLFCGYKKTNNIFCWDIRKSNRVLCEFPRVCETNQSLCFHIDPLSGCFLATGSQDGKVFIYDLTKYEATADGSPSIASPSFDIPVSTDAVGQVIFHPSYSMEFPYIATCSGQRHFPLACLDSSDSDFEDDKIENIVSVWDLSNIGEYAVV